MLIRFIMNKGLKMFNCGGRLYFGKWSMGQEPKDYTTEELESLFNFYSYVRRYQPDDNFILDKIHDIVDELQKREKCQDKNLKI